MRHAYFSEELGPRFLPKPTTAVTNRRLYWILLWARPRGCFFLSCFATLGVCPRTFPARASDPCTLPMSTAAVGLRNDGGGGGLEGGCARVGGGGGWVRWVAEGSWGTEGWWLHRHQ